MQKIKEKFICFFRRLRQANIGSTLSVKKTANARKANKNDMLPEPKAEKEITYQKLFWLFMAGSIAGVLMEGIFCLLTKGRWESHVVSVFGSFNILYGLGAVLFYIGAVMLKEKPILFRVLVMAVAATALELLCGLMLKYGLGMRAWNYDNSFLNYKGLICFWFSVAWGLAAFGFCKLHPYITRALSKFRGRGWGVSCAVLSVFMAVNLTLTSVSIVRWSERHYGIEALTQFGRDVDLETPDEWMQNRFVEWEFLE